MAVISVACARTPPTLEPVTAPALNDDAQPFIIDTDMGTDDAMAILFLLGRPDVDVKAIVVVGNGLATCEGGVKNARGLTALAGRPEIPVACDSETPLEGSHVYPGFMRDGADKLGGMALPENATDETTSTGIDLLTETLNANSDVHLLTLGGLTNVAKALEAQPDLIEHIRMITIMGGAVNVDGNTTIPGVADGNKYAEFNIWIDPEAAQMVFASGAPITLVPLDATNAVPLNNGFMDTLKNDQTAAPAVFTYELLNSNPLFIMSGGYYFWDPLAAGISIDESLATFETYSLIVETEGDEIGRTLIADDGYSIRVATGADGDAFRALFLDILNGRLAVPQ
jgi:inosine-uridine nucleoside N-ribohydrolase